MKDLILNLSMDELLELWGLACQKRRRLIRRNKHDTPASDRLRSLIMKIAAARGETAQSDSPLSERDIAEALRQLEPKALLELLQTQISTGLAIVESGSLRKTSELPAVPGTPLLRIGDFTIYARSEKP